MENDEDRILDFIGDENRFLSKEEIIDHVKMKKATVVKILKKLKDDSHIDTRGTGKKGDPEKYGRLFCTE